MRNQYEDISGQYQDARKTPSTEYLEAPSLVRAVGPLTGKSVIDFACGEGFFTRAWKELGAESVTGVDLSPEMIKLALHQEAAKPLGINYLVADASVKRKIGQFDIATAVFLFNYASDVESLSLMMENVCDNLVYGGRLVAVVPNPDFVNGRLDTLQYGYFLEESARDGSGAKVKMTFTGEKAFSIEFTQWGRAVYETALRERGFTDIQWTFFTVSEEGMRLLGSEFWRATLENPKSIILSAVKTAGGTARDQCPK